MASFGITSNSSWSFFTDRDNGFFYEMVTYPMSRAQYLLGKSLFAVFIGVMQATTTLALGSWLLRIQSRADLSPVLFAATAVGTVGWFFFFTISALKVRRNDLFNSVTSFFYFPFLLGSSTFYPLEPLPRWLRGVALANPISWQVDLLRYGSVGLGDPRRLAFEAIWFALFLLACFACAVRCLNQG